MKPVRVLHVNFSDLDGGAARAANRIHRAQRRIGIDSYLLAMQLRERDPFVVRPLTKARRGLHYASRFCAKQILGLQRTPSNPSLHSVNWFSTGLADWINRSDFDLVNLHWIAAEMLSIEEIGSIQKPLFWTLHDMWAFCGAEHYDDFESPGRYVEGYNRRNRPDACSGVDFDAWVWGRKRKAWANQKINIVGPSCWITECARRSALFRTQVATTIPNCVDPRIYKPIEKRLAREILGLNPGKRYILFGALNSTSDSRKGFHLLQPALARIAHNPDVAAATELLVFGANEPQEAVELGLPTRYMGTFHDDVSLTLLYSAADVFVAPSMQDNLPNTLVEAMCCGTPCVAFSIGGMPDLIANPHRGRLVDAFDIEGFARGILELLGHPHYEALSRDCSLDALAEYSDAVVASRYEDFYEAGLRAYREGN